MSRNRDVAEAIPTKQFFVSMLTRDIGLADAILDLLDNCLDGVLRSAGSKNRVNYSKHFVKISLSPTKFVIEDNCGGIPRDIAKHYAFKMGREPDDTRDSNSETIGMYGVGMKRAIFKMGKNANVNTNNNGDAYEVHIGPEWLDNKAWDPLPIKNITGQKKLDKPGTRIEVTSLHDGVAEHYKNEAFINELVTSIGEHFTNFLTKGLRIEVNNSQVMPVLVKVLGTQDSKGPVPYTYQNVIDGVQVSIVVGLNTGKSMYEDEDETNRFESTRSASTAGWTVFCNDRAVIVGDKSRLTGWGDRIPMYHGQFSVITGIVEFRSSSAEKLPITTTKRALDTSSNVWLAARAKMCEGLRIWINHTNMWKNHPRSEQSEHWNKAKPLSLQEAIKLTDTRKPTQKKDGSIEYNPATKKVLPKPATKKPSSRRICYSKTIEEIKFVSEALFDNGDEKPGVVGEKCFDIVSEKLHQEENE